MKNNSVVTLENNHKNRKLIDYAQMIDLDEELKISIEKSDTKLIQESDKRNGNTKEDKEKH